MTLYDAYYILCLPCSAIESLERIVSLYAQQLSLNETQRFVTPSLTLITELVSTNLTSHHWTKIYVMLTKTWAFLYMFGGDRAEFKINEICRKFYSILHIFLHAWNSYFCLVHAQSQETNIGIVYALSLTCRRVSILLLGKEEAIS